MHSYYTRPVAHCRHHWSLGPNVGILGIPHGVLLWFFDSCHQELVASFPQYRPIHYGGCTAYTGENVSSTSWCSSTSTIKTWHCWSVLRYSLWVPVWAITSRCSNTTYLDPAYALLPSCNQDSIPLPLIKKIALCLATRFNLPTKDIQPHLQTALVKQYGKIWCLDGGDVINSSALVTMGDDHWDVTYVWVSFGWVDDGNGKGHYDPLSVEVLHKDYHSGFDVDTIVLNLILMWVSQETPCECAMFEFWRTYVISFLGLCSHYPQTFGCQHTPDWWYWLPTRETMVSVLGLTCTTPGAIAGACMIVCLYYHSSAHFSVVFWFTIGMLGTFSGRLSSCTRPRIWDQLPRWLWLLSTTSNWWTGQTKEVCSQHLLRVGQDFLPSNFWYRLWSWIVNGQWWLNGSGTGNAEHSWGRGWGGGGGWWTRGWMRAGNLVWL